MIRRIRFIVRASEIIAITESGLQSRYRTWQEAFTHNPPEFCHYSISFLRATS